MEVTYEVIQSMFPPSDLKAPGLNSALAAGVKLVPKIVAFANDFFVKCRIEDELTRNAPELKKARGASEGVLVVAQIKEWSVPDTTATRIKHLHEILIGPAGNDFRDAFRNFMMSPRMHSGPGVGWRLSSKYLWVTAP